MIKKKIEGSVLTMSITLVMDISVRKQRWHSVKGIVIHQLRRVTYDRPKSLILRMSCAGNGIECNHGMLGTNATCCRSKPIPSSRVLLNYKKVAYGCWLCLERPVDILNGLLSLVCFAGFVASFNTYVCTKRWFLSFSQINAISFSMTGIKNHIHISSKVIQGFLEK